MENKAFEPRQYCGEGWKAGELVNQTLDIETLLANQYEGYQGKMKVNVTIGSIRPETMAKRQEKNPKDKRTHSVWINTYMRQEHKAPDQAAMDNDF